MNAKERALERLGFQSQSAPSPALTQDNQEEDRKLGRLQGYRTINH